MTSSEMRQIAHLVAKEVYEMLSNDKRFAAKVNKAVVKKRMLSTSQAAELLGISKWLVRDIADRLGAVKANAKGDVAGKKRYGHLYFAEEGLIERYQEYLRTK